MTFETPDSQPFEVQSNGCADCDAKLADMTAALLGVQATLESVVNAVNVVGQQNQYQSDALQKIVEMVGQFGAQFSNGMNPMSMLKMLAGGKKNHG